MKPARKTIAVATVAAAALVVGCTVSTGGLPAPRDLVEAGALSPGADTAALDRARALAITECAACHRFFWPREYPPESWRAVIPDMGRRASLSQSQIEALQVYFEAASRFAPHSLRQPRSP